jgi:PilZ domain
MPELSRAVSPEAGSQRQHTERCEQRSDVQLTVTVYGFATTGKLFVEHCSTRNISHSGCCLRLQTRPQAGSALALRPLRWGISAKGASQLLFQVAWLRQDGDGWLVGASSLGPADLYCLAFRALYEDKRRHHLA